jgi:hypothetical protein
VTGSLRHIYEHYGFPISEDLLLGLGRGLGFVYVHIAGLDPFYGGRANVALGEEGLEKTAGRRTGSGWKRTTASARKAQQALRLPGQASPYSISTWAPAHFDLPTVPLRWHVVVVAGSASGGRAIADRTGTQ